MLPARVIEMCRPAMVADSVLHIDLAALRARGIEALILDLDNTLVLWRAREIADEVAAWIHGAREMGFRVCIVSNATHSRRVEVIARQLDVPFAVRASKPRRRAFHRAAALLGVSPAQTAVIGDQVFTDVLGGNRAGMFTVLVTPIDRKREFVWTKCMRVVERAIERHTHSHLKNT